MRFPFHFKLIAWTLILAALGPSCASTAGRPLVLASFTQNYVQVSIRLERDPAGNAVLSATFTPERGHHLYSKDIPLDGLEGLGRPTLLELTPGSQMAALAGLTESIQAQEPDFEPKELHVYPVGPVTLSLPVKLPPGTDWFDDEVKVTYMACTAYQCKPPVEGKIVQVRVPGAELFHDQ